MNRTVLAIAGAIGFALMTSTAVAQGYGYGSYNDGYGTYYGPPPEEVIVTPPYYGPSRSSIGAPYEDVSMSRPVRIDDLDLRTDWGVAALRDRIGYTARALCRRLNAMYPISADDTHVSWPSDTNCYDHAVDRAWVQADQAIRMARYGNYPSYGGYGRY